MKFGTELKAHLTSEWRQQYIEYEVTRRSYFLTKQFVCVGRKTVCFPDYFKFNYNLPNT